MIINDKVLVEAGVSKIRNSSELYPAFQKRFNEIFGRYPECPSCGSSQGNKDWSMFKKYVETGELDVNNKKNRGNLNKSSMENKTFELRDKYKIYALNYKHKNGRILRRNIFGYKMDDEFATLYLTNPEGIEEEITIQERRKEFIKLPNSVSENKDELKKEKYNKVVSELKSLGIEQDKIEGKELEDLLLILDSLKTETKINEIKQAKNNSRTK